jgi:uncharacterized protein (DUF1697 family)
MPRYAAFLRAVNLGRNRRVGGAQLRSLFEAAGFDDVATFRTSGNVAFGCDRESGMAERIEGALEEELGYAVPVFLRSESEMRAMAAHEPFKRRLVEASKGKLQAILLSERPSKQDRDVVLALSTEQDRLAFGERELYWLPSGGGTQTSALDQKRIDALLGPVTMRTKGTIEQMTEKRFPSSPAES